MEELEKYDFECLSPYTDEEFKEVYKDAVRLLEFAEREGIKDSFVLTADYDIPADVFLDMIDMRLLNTNLNMKHPDMKDLSPALILFEMILKVLPEDMNYSSMVRQKTSLLFKMSRPSEAEAFMREYLKNNPLDVYAYVELITDFDGIMHNTEKAKEYLELGLSHPEMDEYEVLEEYMSDFEE